MKNEDVITEKRLKETLLLDKHFNPEKLRSVLKKELELLLQDYGDIKENTIDFDIKITESGDYEVVLKATLSRIKTFEYFD